MDFDKWIVSCNYHYNISLSLLRLRYQNTIDWGLQTKDTDFSLFWRLGKQKSGLQYGWFLGECTLSGLKRTLFLLCPHLIEWERAMGSSSSYKHANHIIRAIPSSYLTFKAPATKTVTLRVKLQHMNAGGT